MWPNAGKKLVVCILTWWWHKLQLCCHACPCNSNATTPIILWNLLKSDVRLKPCSRVKTFLLLSLTKFGNVCVCVIDITDTFQSFQACCFSSARYLDTVTSFSISLQQCNVSHSSLFHNCSMVLGSHFLAFRAGGKLTTIPNNIKKHKFSSYSCGQFIKYISATDC